MSLISFEDLINTPLHRKLTIEIAGLGALEVSELTGIEAAELRQTVRGLSDDDSEANETFIARWAARLISGKMPADEDIYLLRLNQSSKVLTEIYTKGCAFNLISDAEKE